VDAWFHDETANVEKKARNSKSRATVVRDVPIASNPSADALMAPKSSFQYLSVPYEDQAFKYFMDSCATGLEQPPFSSQAYHQHLSTHGVHPLVATTMTALGMAGLANLRMDPALKRQATQWYLVKHPLLRKLQAQGLLKSVVSRALRKACINLVDLKP
jgi:TPR repeat protein